MDHLHLIHEYPVVQGVSQGPEAAVKWVAAHVAEEIRIFWWKGGGSAVIVGPLVVGVLFDLGIAGS